MLKNAVRRVLNIKKEPIKSTSEKSTSNTDFWTEHNVTSHAQFSSAQESLDYFHWRNDLYYKYIEFLPVAGYDDKVIVDFGCGPGHDLVGFGIYSKPKTLIGIDLSSSSLAEAESRLKLHNIKATLIQNSEEITKLNFDDNSIDYIHCSGVLHHTKNPEALLREFRRLLKLGGEARFMIYNYESLWLHLYVAYQQRIVKGKYNDVDIRTAFSKFTDGEDCPISRVYKPNEFINLSKQAGFNCEFLGAALAMGEMDALQYRYKAIENRLLDKEHRDFLINLTLDEHGFAMSNGYYAGVDGCYLLRKESE